MRKDRFLEQHKSKLMPRGDSPFQVIKRINDYTYQLDLPSESNISATFNVSYLSSYFVDDDLKLNLFEEERNDMDITMCVHTTSKKLEAPKGQTTRAQAKRFK